ncbi:MAG: ParB N-terminal domain-containing protein [Cyanobacteria bacterium P01_C01_bin.72]
MSEAEELPAIVDLNPKKLISRQTEAEMRPNMVDRLRKKLRKRGFDRSQPIEAVDIGGSLIIKDGHHRTAAAVREKLTSVPVRIYTVTGKEAAQYRVEVAEAEQSRNLDS